MRRESATLSENNNSDSEIEDVVETLPKPPPGVQGFSHPAFPRPDPLPKSLKTLAGLGLAKVSCFVFNSFFPCTFLHTIPLILWWQKGSHHRNRNPQSHDTKWCDNKSHTCACHYERKELQSTEEWTLGAGDGQGGLVCCNSWGRKESDTTERLNWTGLKLVSGSSHSQA